MNHEERFTRYIFKNYEGKFKCSECCIDTLKVMDIKFKNKVVAEITLGCCEARFPETVIYDDYFPD